MEQDELMEMLMAENGFDPESGQSNVAGNVVEAPAKVQSDNGQSNELPVLMRVLRSLPPEERAEALEIAQALEISPQSDQLLYAMLVGLGLHKTMLKAVPDRMAEAGERALGEFNSTANHVKTELSQSLTESAANVIQAGEQVSIQIQKIVNSAAAQIQIAAGKGAQNAIEKIDIAPIVETAISKVAGKTEIALARK